MSRPMYFGTRGFMQYIPMPSVDAGTSVVGWSGGKSQRLNGTASVRNSKGGSKEYNFSWNLASPDTLRPITDYRAGVYDSIDGSNLIYFLDPATEGANVLPQLWATPAQAAADGMALIPGQRASVIATPANGNLYPARSAVFTAKASSRTIWVPIPPGYTGWLGAHGSGIDGVIATPTSGLSSLTPVPLPMIPVTSSDRVNTSFTSGACDGVLLSLANNGPASTDAFVLSGTIMQILKTGVTPAIGGFISGQGHSGCEFEGDVQVTEHSHRLVAMSAKLVETGSGL